MRTRLEDTAYVGRRADGSLELARALGPILDIHCHLALTYLPTGQVDLSADAVGDLYLSVDKELDLERYLNTQFDDRELFTLRRDLSVQALLPSGGKRQTHTGPALVRSMRELGIDRSVILAIDLPHSNRNTEGYVTVAGDHDGLIAAAAIHPFAPHAERSLREAVSRGARAFKMHPAVQQMRPDHPRAMRLYEVCGELGIPVVWHCGPVGIAGERADRRCHLKHYWTPVHELPGTTFVLGHSGALQYERACRLPNMYDNVYVELSSQGLEGMRHILGTVPPERIINGSDWPFYHQAISVTKVALATEDDEDLRHRILWANAAALFGVSPASSPAPARSDH